MNSIREKTINHIYNFLSEDIEAKKLPKTMLQELAKCIEKSCNNYSVVYVRDHNIVPLWDNEDFIEFYSTVVYRVIINIMPESSINICHPGNTRYLITRVLNYAQNLEPQIDVTRIAFMEPNELNPHINKPYEDMIELRKTQKVELKTTKMYKCPRCNGRDAKYHRKQTRSGDEGYTLFITCQICYATWRIYG